VQRLLGCCPRAQLRFDELTALVARYQHDEQVRVDDDSSSAPHFETGAGVSRQRDTIHRRKLRAESGGTTQQVEISHVRLREVGAHHLVDDLLGRDASALRLAPYERVGIRPQFDRSGLGCHSPTVCPRRGEPGVQRRTMASEPHALRDEQCDGCWEEPVARVRVPPGDGLLLDLDLAGG